KQKVPGPNRRPESEAQNHGGWKNSEERGDGHLPSRRRTVWRAKPRLESCQLAIYRFAFRQRSRALLPRFEQRRSIEVIALLLVGERAQDAVFAGIRTRCRRQHTCPPDAAMRERGLEKLAQRRLKFRFAAGS